ncbi:MAG: DUF4349 domain-containing protein [Hyphomonadaceae bacterium]
MFRIASVGLAALALAACGGGEGVDGYAGNAATMPEMAMASAPPPMYAKDAADDFSREENFVQPDPGGGGGAPAGTAPMMAYTYAWNFSVPTENMQGLQAAHKKLCEDAGPANCYITNSSLDAIGKEGASGYLSMRATEAWVRSFETGVAEGLKPFGASVYSNTRGAEELTAQIVDHEARLRSMVAHRDALQKMLDDKPGRLSDLLEIQQALAQAQGDIDSRQSLLAALKLRVSMSVLTFSYQPEYAAVSNSIWRPITDAFGDFGPAFARTVAAIISFVAEVLPIVLLGGLAIWLGMILFRWRGRRRAAKVQNSPARTGS